MRKETKEILLVCGIYVGIGAAIGALVGLRLSFTALSHLMVGRILGFAMPALFIVILLGKLSYYFYKWEEDTGRETDDLIGASIVLSILTLVSIIVGGIIATSYFSGAVVMGSTALAGAVIAVVSPLIATAALGVGGGILSLVLDFLTELTSHKREVLAGAIIGASTVFALSFSVALSPLVIGGVVGAISGTLFAGSSTSLGKSTQERINFCFTMYSLGAVTGVGLVAAANAIFPCVMLMESAVSLGAVIGAISPVLGLFAYEKVNEYIISPVVKKVTECFPLGIRPTA